MSVVKTIQDGRGRSYVCIVLNGKDNYQEWSFCIKKHLKSANLIECIESSRKNEPSESNSRENDAFSFILSTLGASEITQVMHCETALEMWNHLEKVHGKKTSNHQLELINELNSFKCSKTSEVPSIINKILVIKGKLGALKVNLNDNMVMSAIIKALPSTLDNFMENWRMQDVEKQTLTRLTDRLIEKCNMIGESEEAAMVAYNQSRKKEYNQHETTPENNSQKVCNYCHKFGHWKSECRKLKYNQQQLESDTLLNTRSNSNDQYPQTQRNRAWEATHRQHIINANNRYRMANTNYETIPYGQLLQRPVQRQQNVRTSQTDQYIQPKQRANPSHAACVTEDEGWLYDGTAFMALRNNHFRSEIDDISLWIADSGCSAHMTPHRDLLHKFVPLMTPLNIRLGDNHILHAVGKGVVKTATGFLQDVLFVPNLHSNLFSISMAGERGLQFRGDKNQISFYKNNELKLQGFRRGGVFIIKFRVVRVKPETAMTATTLENWHRRLAHLDPNLIQKMIASNSVEGLQVIEREKEVCIDCQLNKCVRTSHPPRSTPRANKAGQSLHLDLLVAPEKYTSLTGNKYALVCVDEFSKYRMVECLKRKIPTEAIKMLINKCELQTGNSVLTITTDNGQEFKSESLQIFLEHKGIEHKKSVDYVPQQNGMAERENRSLLAQVRTIINSAKLQPELWDEAMRTATYVNNRLISKTTTITPYELWTGRKPNIKNFKIFGQQAVVMTPTVNRDKYDEKGSIMILVGYTDNWQTYRFLNPENKRIIESCDVRFLPYIGLPTSTTEPHQLQERQSSIQSTFGTQEQPAELIREPFDMDIDSENDHLIEQQTNHEDDMNNIEHNDLSFEPNYEGPNHFTTAIDESAMNPQTEAMTDGRTERLDDGLETPIPQDQDNDIEDRVEEQDEPTLTDIGGQNTSTPIAPLRITRALPRRDYKALSKGQDNLSAMVATKLTPTSVKEALNGPYSEQWRTAMNDEMDSIIQNEVFELVDKPPNTNIITSRWVLTTKTDANGREKFKARLVARGFTQRLGIDYNCTYSPVAYTTTIRFLLAFSAAHKLMLKQFDVKTAFLYGHLDENVYMYQPDGYTDETNKVWKLKRSLYGLKQSPRMWNQRISEQLIKLGLHMSDADDCLFIRDDPFTIIAVYVDDGLIIAKNEETIDDLIIELRKSFETHVIKSNKFLGIQYQIMSSGIFIHQSDYIQQVIESFGMKNSNASPTPFEPGQKQLDERPLEEDRPFKELVGSLQYAASQTRPDISFTVNYLSRKMVKPTENDWQIGKRCLRYLQGTTDWGIFYPTPNMTTIEAYSDADYAGDPTTYRSTSGIALMMGEALISWKSKLQRHATTSTSEAELLALSDATKEVIKMRKVQQNLNITSNLQEPTTIWCDNQGTVLISKDEMSSQRTRHLGAHLAFVREKNENQTISVKHTPKDQQMADWLTKPLHKQKFTENRNRLMTSLQIILSCMLSLTLILPTDSSLIIDAPVLKWSPLNTKFETGLQDITISLSITPPCAGIKQTFDTYSENSTYHRMFGKLLERCTNLFQKEYLPSYMRLTQACQQFERRRQRKSRLIREADPTSIWLSAIPIIGPTGYQIGQLYNPNSAYHTIWKNEAGIEKIELSLAETKEKFTHLTNLNNNNIQLINDTSNEQIEIKKSVDEIIQATPEIAWSASETLHFIHQRSKSFDKIRRSIEEDEAEMEELFHMTNFEILDLKRTTDAKLLKIQVETLRVTLNIRIPVFDSETVLYQAHKIHKWISQDTIEIYNGPTLAVNNFTSDCLQLLEIESPPSTMKMTCKNSSHPIEVLVSKNIINRTLDDTDIKKFKEPLIIYDQHETIIQCYGHNASVLLYETFSCPKQPFKIPTGLPFNIDGIPNTYEAIKLQMEDPVPEKLAFMPSSSKIDQLKTEWKNLIDKMQFENDQISNLNHNNSMFFNLDSIPNEVTFSTTAIILILILTLIIYYSMKKSTVQMLIEAQISKEFSTKNTGLSYSTPNINICITNASESEKKNLYPSLDSNQLNKIYPTAPVPRRPTPFPSNQTSISLLSSINDNIIDSKGQLPYNPLKPHRFPVRKFDSTISLPHKLGTPIPHYKPEKKSKIVTILDQGGMLAE